MQEPCDWLGYLYLTAGQTVLVQVSSAAFSTVTLVQPYNGNQSNWLIATATDGNTSWLMFTVAANQAGDWYFGATSPSATASGSFTMQITLDPHPFVSTALTELDYTYYADGSVHTVTDSSNVAGLSGQSGTTTYAYDAMDNLTQLQQSGTGVTSKQVNYTYYADSQTHTVSRSVGGVAVAASTYTYDGMGRISTLQHTYGTSGVINYSWQYDAASNVTEEVSPDGTDNYALDASNQLTSASLTGEGYTYDQNGNRTDSGYVTGANNEMLSDGIYTYTYDKNGNRTAKFIDANHNGVLDANDTSVTLYTWDQRNRLTEEEIEPTYGNPSEIVYFTYDYANRQIARYDYFVGGSTIAYTVYNGQNAYLQVTDPNYLGGGSGNTTAGISQRYLDGPGVDQIIATETYTGGTSVVYVGLGNNDGTMCDVVSTSGVDTHVKFNSFGEPTGGTAPINDFLFGLNGMRFDPASGDYQTGTVQYDPSTGRRLEQDPIGFASGTTNLTAWCENSPVDRIDASGECWNAGPGNGSSYDQYLLTGSLSSPSSFSSPAIRPGAGGQQ